MLRSDENVIETISIDIPYGDASVRTAGTIVNLGSEGAVAIVDEYVQDNAAIVCCCKIQFAIAVEVTHSDGIGSTGGRVINVSDEGAVAVVDENGSIV